MQHFQLYVYIRSTVHNYGHYAVIGKLYLCIWGYTATACYRRANFLIDYNKKP